LLVRVLRLEVVDFIHHYRRRVNQVNFMGACG